jgi:hypothetical protein
MKLNFKIISTSSDGRVTVLINGIKYFYAIGGYQIPKILRLVKRHPGKALDYLKRSAGNNFYREKKNNATD